MSIFIEQRWKSGTMPWNTSDLPDQLLEEGRRWAVFIHKATVVADITPTYDTSSRVMCLGINNFSYVPRAKRHIKNMSPSGTNLPGTVVYDFELKWEEQLSTPPRESFYLPKEIPILDIYNFPSSGNPFGFTLDTEGTIVDVDVCVTYRFERMCSSYA